MVTCTYPPFHEQAIHCIAFGALDVPKRGFTEGSRSKIVQIANGLTTLSSGLHQIPSRLATLFLSLIGDRQLDISLEPPSNCTYVTVLLGGKLTVLRAAGPSKNIRFGHIVVMQGRDGTAPE